MGADLIIATLWIREDAKPDWEKAEAMAKAIRYGEEGESFPSVASEGAIYDEIQHMPDDEAEARLQEALTDHLQLVRDAVDNYATEDGRRDLTATQFAGWLVYVTGGMSWGDSPGDLFDSISELNQFELLEAAGFYDDTNAVTVTFSKT